MLVSVIIPVHNRAASIQRATASVLAQKGVKLEVLVVDDASTDETVNALKAIRDPRLRILRQPRNQGVSAARNRGLAEAQGHMLALLDSDDWWLPGKMTRHLDYHRAGPWRISQTDEIWIRHDCRVNPKHKHAKPEGWFFAQALQACLISPSCVLFDRDFWREVGPFDETLPACEDYDLWLRTLVRHPAGLCRNRLVCKTGGHADQLSRRIIGLDLYRLRAMEKLLRTQSLNAWQHGLTVQALRAKARVYVQGCLKRDKPEEALRIKAWLGPWLGP